MPGKQKDTRTRITIALDKTLEAEIQAEMMLRLAAGEKADKSGVVAEALAWYFKNVSKFAKPAAAPAKGKSKAATATGAAAATAKSKAKEIAKPKEKAKSKGRSTAK